MSNEQLALELTKLAVSNNTNINVGETFKNILGILKENKEEEEEEEKQEIDIAYVKYKYEKLIHSLTCVLGKDGNNFIMKDDILELIKEAENE